MIELSNEQPLTVIKPVYVIWVRLLRYLPLQLNLTFVGAGIGGGVGFLIMLLFNLSYSFFAPFILCGLLFFFGTPAVIYVIEHSTYEKTDYKFYKDHLEYAEGFWTIQHKNIQYRNVTEVMLERNIIQRMCGLGTIFLRVPAGYYSGNGIRVADIRDSEEVYQKIQVIIQNQGTLKGEVL